MKILMTLRQAISCVAIMCGAFLIFASFVWVFTEEYGRAVVDFGTGLLVLWYEIHIAERVWRNKSESTK